MLRLGEDGDSSQDDAAERGETLPPSVDAESRAKPAQSRISRIAYFILPRGLQTVMQITGARWKSPSVAASASSVAASIVPPSEAQENGQCMSVSPAVPEALNNEMQSDHRSADINREQTPSVVSSRSSANNHTLGPSFTSSLTSTPSTSLFSEPTPTYEYNKGVFVSPELEMSPQHLDVWKQKIEGRLWHILDNNFEAVRGSEPSIMVEFMMAGPEPDVSGMNPTIVVTCFHEVNKKRLRVIIKKQKWLHEYGYDAVVVAGSYATLSGDGEFEASDVVTVQAMLSPELNTLCGVSAHISTIDHESPARFTIGGIVNVGREPYGLTVSHVLERVLAQRDAVHQGGQDSESGLSTSEDEDEFGPFLKFPKHVGRVTKVKDRSKSMTRPLTPPHEIEEEGPTLRGYTIVGELMSEDALATRKLDWALIHIRKSNLAQDLYQSNLVHLPGHDTPVSIKSAAEGPLLARSEVWINAGSSGVVRAWLTGCPTTMCINGHVIEAHQVIPDVALVPGDSGSWVIQGSQACGHIIAGRKGVPWVYMVAMSHILNEINRHMNGQSVVVAHGHDKSTAYATTMNPPRRMLSYDSTATGPISDTQSPEHEKTITLSDMPVLSQQDKVNLGVQLWGNVNRASAINLTTYWEYYRQSWARYRLLSGQHRSLQSHLILHTHQDLLEITQMLKCGVQRQEVKDILRSKSEDNCSEHSLNSAIELAASLLVMIDTRPNLDGVSWSTRLKWDQGTLADFIHRLLETEQATKQSVLGDENTEGINPCVKAVSLERIGGLNIVWTNDLAAHLLLRTGPNKRNTIHIFHHASFLKYQLQSSESLLPESLVAETLLTLRLLFPEDDRDTKKWYEKKMRKTVSKLDPEIVKCGSSPEKSDCGTQEFKYWGERLRIIQEELENTRPKNLKQLWYDRRNAAQWYSCWVVVALVLLSLIAVTLSIVQVALSYNSYHSVHQALLGDGLERNESGRLWWNSSWECVVAVELTTYSYQNSLWETVEGSSTTNRNGNLLCETVTVDPTTSRSENPLGDTVTVNPTTTVVNLARFPTATMSSATIIVQ